MKWSAQAGGWFKALLTYFSSIKPLNLLSFQSARNLSLATRPRSLPYAHVGYVS